MIKRLDELNNFKRGDKTIGAIYRGETLIWPKLPPIEETFYYLVGDITEVRNPILNTSKIVSGIARFDKNGIFDPTFITDQSALRSITCVDLVGDKILLGGSFTSYLDSGTSIGLVMLNQNGTIFSTFKNFQRTTPSGIQNGVLFKVKLLNNGNIVCYGDFDIYEGIGGKNKMITINQSGDLITNFEDQPSGGSFIPSISNASEIVEINNSIIVKTTRRVIAYNLNGTIKWQTLIDDFDSIPTGPFLINNHIYVNTSNDIYKLDVETGSIIQQINLQSRIIGSTPDQNILLSKSGDLNPSNRMLAKYNRNDLSRMLFDNTERLNTGVYNSSSLTSDDKIFIFGDFNDTLVNVRCIFRLDENGVMDNSLFSGGNIGDFNNIYDVVETKI